MNFIMGESDYSALLQRALATNDVDKVLSFLSVNRNEKLIGEDRDKLLNFIANTADVSQMRRFVDEGSVYNEEIFDKLLEQHTLFSTTSVDFVFLQDAKTLVVMNQLKSKAPALIDECRNLIPFLTGNGKRKIVRMMLEIHENFPEMLSLDEVSQVIAGVEL